LAEGKLFHVTVEVTVDMVVLADSAEQAGAWGEEHWHREVSDGCPEVRVLMPTEIVRKSQVPYDDWLEVPPYVANDSHTHDTVGELLAQRDPPQGAGP
jgi:hypothetical protein